MIPHQVERCNSVGEISTRCSFRYRYFTLVPCAEKGLPVISIVQDDGAFAVRVDGLVLSCFDEWLLQAPIAQAARWAIGGRADISRQGPDGIRMRVSSIADLRIPLQRHLALADHSPTVLAGRLSGHLARQASATEVFARACWDVFIAGQGADCIDAFHRMRRHLEMGAVDLFSSIWWDEHLSGHLLSLATGEEGGGAESVLAQAVPDNAGLILALPGEVRGLKRPSPSLADVRIEELMAVVADHVQVTRRLASEQGRTSLVDCLRLVLASSELLSQAWACCAATLGASLGQLVGRDCGDGWDRKVREVLQEVP